VPAAWSRAVGAAPPQAEAGQAAPAPTSQRRPQAMADRNASRRGRAGRVPLGPRTSTWPRATPRPRRSTRGRPHPPLPAPRRSQAMADRDAYSGHRPSVGDGGRGREAEGGVGEREAERTGRRCPTGSREGEGEGEGVGRIEK